MLGAGERCGAENSLLATWLSSCDLCSPVPSLGMNDISSHEVVPRVFLKHSENEEKEADLPYSRFR